MKTEEINKIIDLVQKDWSKSQSHVIYCQKLICYLSKKRSDDVKHLTYSSFKLILNQPIEDRVLLESLSYLAGEKIKILEVHFELIDESENTYILSSDDVADLMKDGKLAHPITGSEIPYAKERVHLFYSPSQSFAHLIDA